MIRRAPLSGGPVETVVDQNQGKGCGWYTPLAVDADNLYFEDCTGIVAFPK
ncbi:MAG: hypothetical protein HY908_10365 [Myxococcales bacterium]|nr:hypothetical protein [Myxococcales bacterium]